MTEVKTYIVLIVTSSLPFKNKKTGRFFCGIKVGNNIVYCSAVRLQVPLALMISMGRQRGENWSVSISQRLRYWFSIMQLDFFFNNINHTWCWKIIWWRDIMGSCGRWVVTSISQKNDKNIQVFTVVTSLSPQCKN